jgi:mRNA interferase HicA
LTSKELKRWLESQGCTFAPGKGGHVLVRLGDRRSVLPMHGAKRDLPKGLVEGIKRQLGLKGGSS